MSTGIDAAKGVPLQNTVPQSWLGLTSAPTTPPAWASIGNLTPAQIRNLQAQIAYTQSNWNYSLISNTNSLGRYQFTPQTLENYGLLAAGSNAAYGTVCVNYVHCWRPVFVNTGQNAYTNYFYNISGLGQFLSNTVAQEHLAYQMLSDLYLGCYRSGSILATDTADVVAGMVSVAWVLGIGTGPTVSSANGTGAYAWRYSNTGSGATAFNQGRYAVLVLSQ